ncbi:FAD-dependent oxidoreductase [Croceicoccus ponticola]|uniref:FAD-dependent oxidoreductase n=1 Tax=Croceicoccus ponticola TaxID=2217664 RepID=A0A437GYK1_9SPHN|nr:FAD-dependent oxidoreductase [Croceicoccus ponticola]RVQ66556.1 FAD-dependent oxidoreductase [Croceicoccus ponticola]
MANVEPILSAGDIATWDRECDVIVIGQGVAGTCSALEAHRAGADVLIVERASGGGGASAMSSGIYYLGGGTAVQKAMGYDDTPDEMAAFMMASCDPLDPVAVRHFCDDSPSHFDWLERQGLPFERTEFKGKAVFLNDTTCLMGTGNEKLWPFNKIARPAPRGHKVAGTGENAGHVGMAPLLSKCEQEGIPAIYDSNVVALVRDEGGRVVGVRIKQAGATIHARARRGVIIAAGSFNMNHEMIAENLPLLGATSEPLGIPSNDGAGVLLGMSAGTATSAMDGVIPTASIYPPGQLIKGIIVNKRGERFVAEDSYHGRTANFVMEQPDQKAWLIVDSEIFAYPEIPTAKHTLVDGWETIEEMEAGLDLPTGSLVRTMAGYNKNAAQGRDPLLHKDASWLKPLDKGPWAAFDISFDRSTYLFITLGGLKTGPNGECLTLRSEPIPGLYAVGASAAHIPRNGKAYASGMSLGPGSYFGRRAGRHAAGANWTD